MNAKMEHYLYASVELRGKKRLQWTGGSQLQIAMTFVDPCVPFSLVPCPGLPTPTCLQPVACVVVVASVAEEVGRRRSGQGCPAVGRRLLAARRGEAALGLPVGAT